MLPIAKVMMVWYRIASFSKWDNTSWLLSSRGGFLRTGPIFPQRCGSLAFCRSFLLTSDLGTARSALSAFSNCSGGLTQRSSEPRLSWSRRPHSAFPVMATTTASPDFENPRSGRTLSVACQLRALLSPSPQNTGIEPGFVFGGKASNVAPAA